MAASARRTWTRGKVRFGSADIYRSYRRSAEGLKAGRPATDDGGADRQRGACASTVKPPGCHQTRDSLQIKRDLATSTGRHCAGPSAFWGAGRRKRGRGLAVPPVAGLPPFFRRRNGGMLSSTEEGR